MQIFQTDGKKWQCALVSDGSLDTLIEVQPVLLKRDGGYGLKAQTIRFSHEYASQIYTKKGRVLNTRFKQLCREAIEAYDTESVPRG
jgi:hypothetical protein